MCVVVLVVERLLVRPEGLIGLVTRDNKERYMILKRLKVYVAGPISLGDMCHNVHKACTVATKILNMGHVPFLPHSNVIWNMVTPLTYEQMTEWDNEWLKACDIVVRIPGTSIGSEAEQSLAEKCGIPVMTISQFDDYCTSINQNKLKEPKESDNNVHLGSTTERTLRMGKQKLSGKKK